MRLRNSRNRENPVLVKNQKTVAVYNRRTNKMRTVRTKLYKFSELNEKAQEKAIEKLYDINVNYEWWESTYEDARNIGLKITGFDLDRNRNAQGEFLLAANEVAANIFRDHGETCETYKTAKSFMEEWEPVFATYMETDDGEDKLIDMEDEFLKSILEDYSIILQHEYEYLTGREAIIESIEANEYEFLQDGSIFRG